ncbi:hypothetical protein D3C86_1359160 [compost metagenome]
MIVRYCQRAIHRVLSRFGQNQARQGCSGSTGQPPTVVIAPTQMRQLLADLILELHAASRTRQTAATFGNRLQIGILLFPWQPETRFVPRSITAITQPVQLHAERLQVFHRRSFLRMPAQQANRGKPEPLAGRGQCMQMIGMRSTEADDAFSTRLFSDFEVFNQLEPFVAADQWVDLIKTQDRDFDAGRGEPVERKRFEGGLGEPVVEREKHRCRFWMKIRHLSNQTVARELAPARLRSSRKSGKSTILIDRI